MENEKVEEGTIDLDPKVIERKEKMKAINTDIMEAITGLSEKHGLKVYMTAHLPELDETGIWTSNNTSQFEQMAFKRILADQ